MAKEDKREEAEKLYTKDGLSCITIAEKLTVSEGTVYRWKNEAAGKGEARDWDSQRRLYNLSPIEMFAMYAETVKGWIIRLKQQPELLADPKIADAMVKHMSVLQKLDIRSQYLGVALDLIKVANRWLAENQSELKEKLEPYWERIYQELAKYSSGKGMF